MNARQSALEYARQHIPQSIEDLKDWLSIPSISTDPDHAADMKKAADWLTNRLKTIGFPTAQFIQTQGHPAVYASWMQAGEAAPTVLLYGHYDVQPAEPLTPWNSSPFTAVQQKDELIARGASDMKGQIIAALAAIQAVASQGALPVNLKVIVEGEEEIGSPHFKTLLEENRSILSSHVALNPDCGMIDSGTPTLIYGLRGLVYFELRVFGPAQDLHSGLFGGVVHNPAQVLCDLIAGMHDASGQVTLPGFYESVLPLEDEERAELARLPIHEKDYLQQSGAPALWGEKGYTAVERAGSRPTLEIHGLQSGFTGSGSKTVLPASAMAKISCRLVPNQDPEQVYRQMCQYLEQHAPSTVRWELDKLPGGSRASITDRHSKAVEAMAEGLKSAWGVAPVFKREGGSISVVEDMQQILGIDSVLTGFGLPGDNIHGPNEHLHLPTWGQGIEALIHFFYNYAEGSHE